EVWGTGSPLREFWHVDDLAEACLFLMNEYNDAGHINVGSGLEISIKELAELVEEITGYTGGLKWDNTKPDGTPRKLMDNSKIATMGWSAGIGLKKGVEAVYKTTFLKENVD